MSGAKNYQSAKRLREIAIIQAEKRAKEERIRLMAELERQIIAEKKEYQKRVKEKLEKQYF